MNALNESLLKLRSMVRELNPQSRWLAGLLLLAVLVGAALLANGFALRSPGYEPLFNRSTDSHELDQFELVFSGANLSGFHRSDDRLLVPAGSRDRYLKALQEAGALTNRPGTDMQKFDEGGNFFESSRVTELRYRNLQIKSLQTTLNSLPFIRVAVVSYDERLEGFASERKRTASVAVYPRDNIELSDLQKQSIIAYVQSSFSGLKRSEISLLEMNRGITTPGSDHNHVSTQDQLSKHKIEEEKRIQNKALELLRLHSYGDAQVVVHVPIEKVSPENPAGWSPPSQASDAKQDIVSNSKTPQAYPVARDRHSFPSKPSGVKLQNIDRERTPHGPTTYSQPPTLTTISSTVLSGSKVQSHGTTVWVSIPYSYYRRALDHEWQVQHPGFTIAQAPPHDPVELDAYRAMTKKNIQDLLLPLLDAKQTGDEVTSRITVTDYFDEQAPPETATSLTRTVLGTIAKSWKTMALLGLCVLLLFLLHAWVKAPLALEDKTQLGEQKDHLAEPIAVRANAISELEHSLWDDDADADHPADAHGDRISATAHSHSSSGALDSPIAYKSIHEVRDELAHLVQSDPRAAAGLLQSWLNASS
jgi:flagellar biosynthesis/type III secretory pathway M-ring protein FliF/YscJ